MSATQDSPSPIAVSEAELRSMTSTLDEMHQESMSDVRESMAALTDRVLSVTRSVADRRAVLFGGAAVLGSVALAACGSSSSGGKTATAGTGPSPSASSTAGSSPYTGDLQVVALAAALENLAVAGYGLVLKSAAAGKYGKVPPAIAEFVTVVQKQHMEHGQAWNGVLTNANLPAIKGAPLTITKPSVAALTAAKTLPAVAAVALGLENAAAETYVFATANVTNPAGIGTAASIAPVEAMHAAILSFVLGKYPVPNSDIGISKAVQPSALTA